MVNVFFLSQATASAPLLSLRAKRLANFMESLPTPDWQVDSLAIYDPRVVLPTQIRNRDVSAYQAGGDQKMSCELLWPQILPRLPSQIDVLFLADPALWEVVQRILSLPMYQATKLVVDTTQADFSLELFKRANLIFVASEHVRDQVQALNGRSASLIRDGVRDANPADYFLSKWQHRLPVFPWALNIVPEVNGQVYRQTVNSFGQSLACVPIDSKVVFLNCAQYALTKEFKDCPFGELNLSRLQTLGFLPEYDFQAVTQLAPIYTLTNHSADENFWITAQALSSGARVVAYKQALVGFESLVDGERVLAVENAAQFQEALRDAFLKPVLTLASVLPDSSNSLYVQFNARTSFAAVPALLQSVMVAA